MCVSRHGFQHIRHFSRHETDVRHATSVSRMENRLIRLEPGLETDVESVTCVSQQRDRYIRGTKARHETDVHNTTFVSRLQILYQNQCTKKFNRHIFLFL